MTRYKPDREILVAGHNVEDDAFKISFIDAVTNQAGQFKISLDDRRGRYSEGNYLAISHPDPITISLDDTLVFKGIIDSPVADVNKKDGKVYEISGRSDFAQLIDIVASRHVVNEDVYSIVNGIITLYNSMISGYSDNQPITVSEILPASGTLTYSNLWKRQSLQGMILDVANFLGTPTTFGGLDEFYDFWVDPSDAFHFVPAGSKSSGVDLGNIGGIELKERKYVIDAFPVKNDLWTWGMNTAMGQGFGRIPLTMQQGYSALGLVDSWTEGNASDYALDGKWMNTIANSSAYAKVGSQSILASTFPIDTSQVAYFSMPMPFGSKWPAQKPFDVMNAYNECENAKNPSGMEETMGQMSSLSYSVLPIPTAVLGSIQLNHWIEVVDVNGSKATSQAVTLTGSSSSTAWQAVSMPFGPESNYSSLYPFNWAGVTEIRYNFQPQGILSGKTVWSIYFDGFSIVKPLVVENADSTATVLRTNTQVLSGKLTWAQTRIYGQSVLQNTMIPQQYYEIKNIGRADIPAGYTFQAEGKTLLAREITYDFDKKQGWLIGMKGFLAV